MPFEGKIPKDEYLPLINMKGARFLGGRSTSVIKDPQVYTHIIFDNSVQFYGIINVKP